MAAPSFVIVENTLKKGMKKYLKTTNPGGKADATAKEALGLQLINNIINGSTKEDVRLPIATGLLRASGSVFVGSNLARTTEDRPVLPDKKGKKQVPTPNRSYSEKKSTITIGFNTPYAARLHETTWVPGGKSPSKQAKNNPLITGSVGNKFVEKHLKADGPELLKLYAEQLKKESGA